MKLFNFWPPFFGAGIRIRKISRDYRSIDVEMRLRFWNRNYVGTHFGGSLYAMTDPFFMLMLMENLGSDYIVWDKAASIRFKRPGRSTVKANFSITSEQIEKIRSEADNAIKVEPVFRVEVSDLEGTLIAEVEKILYVRRKEKLKKDNS